MGMARVAPIVPEETALLCEGCGYVLDGLPADSRCPECGRPIAESTGAQTRRAPAWEGGGGSAFSRFIGTTAEVLFRPTRFYRTFVTRQAPSASRWFGRIHLGLASLLIGVAAAEHFLWMVRLSVSRAALEMARQPWVHAGVTVAMAVVVYEFIYWTTRLAARLTHWEATYRGLRLPLSVVRRGLDYHTVHYLPVALVAAATVVGYQVLLARGTAGFDSAQKYLYVLSGEIVVSALYLFQTYWIGMRNMMYANR